MLSEERIDITIFSSANCFCLSPGMLYPVEIWTVRWQIFQNTTSIFHELLDIRALMKTGVVQNNNAATWSLGQEIKFKPTQKNIAIHVAAHKTHSEQYPTHKSANNIGSTFSAPILSAKTSCPL